MTLADQLYALADSRRRKARKVYPQDMERKRQRMREYYQKNREHLIEKAKERSRATYLGGKYV